MLCSKNTFFYVLGGAINRAQYIPSMIIVFHHSLVDDTMTHSGKQDVKNPTLETQKRFK